MPRNRVFSQRHWPTPGDIDDCWVVSAIQAALEAGPWLPQPTITQFRAMAGDPDDGDRDGGQPEEVYKGIRGVWPSLAPVRIHKGRPIAELRALLYEGRPVSVAVVSGKLPPRLRFGFDGLHQITLKFDGEPSGGKLWIANPLDAPHSGWDQAVFAEIDPALVAYAGAGKWTGVSLPTIDEALRTSFPEAKAWVDAEVKKATSGVRNATLDEGIRALEALKS